MQIFLNTESFDLVSINRNPDEMKAFEDWSEWTHEEHMGLIAMVEKRPEAFMEISLMPDDYGSDPYGKAQWLIDKAAERGKKLTVYRE